MKKLMGLFLVVLSVILVTGCDNNNDNNNSNKTDSNTVTCTQQVAGQELSLIASTNNDKVVKLTVESVTKVGSEELLDASIKVSETIINNYNKLDGVTAKALKRDLNLVISMELDLNKITNETLRELNIAGDVSSMRNSSIKAFKDGLTSSGYTCK